MEEILTPRIRVIRSPRKTVGITVDGEETVTVRAPKWLPDSEIHQVIREAMPWIEKKLEKLRQLPKAEKAEAFTPEELMKIREKAKELIPSRAAYFAEKLGVTYGKITIRFQKTRWGSCSRAGNLNFNGLLALAPPEVLDSVVAHELVHRLEMNHGPAFYEHLRQLMPDYDSCRKWLLKNGRALIRRLPKQ